MGQPLEFNDTVKINDEQGFPSDVLQLEKHQAEGIKFDEIKDQVFEFEKSGFRIYQQKPTRCFLVQEREGKWIHWGYIEIIEQLHTGDSESTYKTKAKYKIIKLYKPEDQEKMTNYLSKEGLSYFE